MMTRVLCLMGAVAVLCGLFPLGASAQCPTGQLDFDYDLGTLDDLLSNVLVDEDGVNLWLNGNPPVWQTIPGQVGPGFSGVDNDGNGIHDDDHFDLLAAVINGSDTEVVQNLNPASVSAIRSAFAANKVQVRTTKVTLCNVKINARAAGIVTIDRTICVTTGETACISVPIVGDQCFDVPPLWGPDGILADVDPQLEERIVNLAAGYMTIGDPKGIAYFQNVLGQITLAALKALVPQLLAGIGKSVPDSDGFGEKAVDCDGIDPIDVPVNLSDPVEIVGTVKVASIDICNAINNFIGKFSCSQGFNCQAALLASTGNLNGTGTNNLTSYLNAATRQQWMQNESISNPPLEIIAQPVPATVESGTPVTMSYEFQGGKPGVAHSHLWTTVDGESFAPGGTVASTRDLVFAYPLAGNSGLYSGVVCDGLWRRRSQPARLTVNLGTFRITQQPQGISGVVPGTNVTLSVQVRGGGTTPSYQWQFDGGEGFTNVGVNSPNLNFPSIDLPDSGQYRVVITGDSTLTSNTVTVQVVDSIRFQTHPASQAVYIGEPIAFNPVVIGQPVGDINYEWQKNSAPINGANGLTYSIGAAQLSDNGTYRLRIFDDTYDVLSNPATVEVALQPEFTQQPVGGGGFEGNSFTFNVTVSGGLTFRNYQWYFQPEDGEPQPIGPNAPSLFLDDLTPDNQGTYFVTVTDARQTITSNTAFLEIFPPFKIVDQPVGAVKFVGQGHTFSVGIEGGTGTLHYQWLKDGQPVGSDNISLTIDPLALSDAGTYRCVVSDDNGTNTSASAVLDVRNRLAITKQPTNVGAYVGQSVTLSIDSSGGIGDIEYRWKRGIVTVGFGKNFVIANATLATTGQYFCEVRDSFDVRTSNTVTVTVVPGVTFPEQPKDAYRFIGDSAQFSVTAQNGLGTLNYRWLKNNVPLPNTGPVLFFEKVFMADEAVYRCEVKDDLFTTSSSSARLFVFEEPTSTGTLITGTLDANQMVPSTISEAEGTSTGRLRPTVGSTSGEFSLVMNTVHTVASSQRIRMRKGLPGNPSGASVVTFNNPGSPSLLNHTFSRIESAELLGGLYHVVIETPSLPDGAIRGQLNADIPEPEGEPTQSCANDVRGDLSACSAHYNRIQSAAVNTSCGAASQDSIHDNMPYNAITFTAASNTAFTAEVLADGTDVSDTVLSLYCHPFNPANPAQNLIAFDDDDGAAPGLSAFKASDGIVLTPGNQYTLVISTYRGAATPQQISGPTGPIAGDFGNYRICLPSSAVVSGVAGGGGDECFVAVEGEGEPEGGEEGEPEGVVEGEPEGGVEGEPEGAVEGEPEGGIEGEEEGSIEARSFSADWDEDGIISLAELLRVIQIFNAGAYYCTLDPESLDGYAITPDDPAIEFGEEGCTRHTSDYQGEEGIIELSELLRLIQFFNLGGVELCPDGVITDDGFCVPVR